ncbi:MAG: hypothetical protein IJT51_05920 [Bacteroidales bacterium]|nr:hypothetical protein [Bacteroidales bacterium]
MSYASFGCLCSFFIASVEIIVGSLFQSSFINNIKYGIPDWIKDKAYSYLDEPLKDVLGKWKKFISIG